MSLLLTFIKRPIATTLLAFGIASSGIIAYGLLPVSPLPQIEFPTISIQAALPGASPEIMATSVATPLERQLGHISGITEMTSSSSLGATSQETSTALHAMFKRPLLLHEVNCRQTFQVIPPIVLSIHQILRF
jgi:multidrug efflux pump subunit AcrB